MAKDIKIRMGNEKQVLTDVKYIETLTEDGEACLWACEDDVRLTTLFNRAAGTYRPLAPFTGYRAAEIDYISGDEDITLGVLRVTRNGIYRAASDPNGPFGGYSKVIVEVDRSSIQPDHIEILDRPTKLVYFPYEEFEYEGIKAIIYQDDKLVWNRHDYVNGIIPLDELTLTINYEGYYSKKNGLTLKYDSSDRLIYVDKRTKNLVYEVTVDSGAGPFFICEIYGYLVDGDQTEYISKIAIMSKNSFTVNVKDYDEDAEDIYAATHYAENNQDYYEYDVSISHNDHPGYSNASRNYAEDSVSEAIYDWENAAYTTLYGVKSIVQESTVDVEWTFPDTDTPFETSFGFKVIPVPQ